MALSLSERQKAILFAAVLIPAIGGLYATTQLIQPAPVQATTVDFVRLDIGGDGWSIHYGPTNTTNNTAFGLLLEASKALSFSVRWSNWTWPAGVLVTAINGAANGLDDRFWQYWVNGRCGNVAADREAIRSGDEVLWNFTVITCG